MRPVFWMAGVSVLAWLAVLVVTDVGTEVFWGMLGPLVVACGSWVMADRTFRQSPERLTGVMAAAFAGKMVFFGAYVAIMLTVVALRPVPFVVSFTGYFVALHLGEALLLRRLFVGGGGAD
jgi:hypothetical protein